MHGTKNRKMFIEEIKNQKIKKGHHSTSQEIDLGRSKMATERVRGPHVAKVSHEESDGPLSKTDSKTVLQSRGLKHDQDDQLPTGSRDLIHASTERKSNHSLLSDHKHLNLNELAAMFIKSTESGGESERQGHARSQSLQRLKYSTEQGQPDGRVLNKITTLQKLRDLRKKKIRHKSLAQSGKDIDSEQAKLQVTFREVIESGS